MWHVTLTVVGDEVDAAEVRAALERLTHEQPFLLSARYAADRAELRYWEEARDLEDAAALALRLWGEHRRHRRAARRGGSPASRWSTGPPSSAGPWTAPPPPWCPPAASGRSEAMRPVPPTDGRASRGRAF